MRHPPPPPHTRPFMVAPQGVHPLPLRLPVLGSPRAGRGTPPPDPIQAGGAGMGGQLTRPLAVCPLPQLRREQDHNAQVLHLPHLHGAAPALAGTEQVGFRGRDGSWGGWVGGRWEAIRAPSFPAEAGVPCLGGTSPELVDGAPPLLVFWAIPAPHTSRLLSSPAWTSSSAGFLTRNSWPRQLFGLSE